MPIGPYGGLNNRDSSYAISSSQAQDLLNVELTPGGKSVRKRHGYGVAFTLSQTTSPVHGVYDFFDSNGNEVNLFFNDTKIFGSIGGAATTVLLSTGPNGATYQCTDSLGQSYCTNGSRTGLYKISGSTLTQIQNVSSTGTMVATCVTRLAMAGFSDAPSRIDLSTDGDFTTWGTGSQGSSPVQITVNAPGARITHIVYAFGRLMWFKDTSFGYILIGNQPLQTDWVVKTIAYDVGTNDNTSIYREGILYFRGKDGHIYAFDGNTYQRISREIAGTVSQAQTRASNSWTQTSQSDWQAGTVSPTSYLETSNLSGYVQLATTTPLAPFVDTTAANFAAGTQTSIDTTTSSGSILLQSTTNYLPIAQATSATNGQGYGNCGTNPARNSQAFYLNTGSIISSATLKMSIINGSPTTFTFKISGDLNATPNQGSVFVSTSVNTSTFTITSSSQPVFGSSTDVKVSFPAVALSGGATYWISIFPDYSCSANVIWFEDLSYSSMTAQFINSGGSTSTFYNPGIFSLYGKRYLPSGTFLSQNFDNGFSTMSWLWNWSTFVASKTTPSNTTLTWETQSSEDAVTWETLASATSGSAPSSTVQRYIRYKGTFGTTDLSTSPVVSDVVINVSSRTRPAAILYSQIKNASSLTAWDTFLSNYSVNGGSIAFYIRSDTYSFTQTSTSPALNSITSGNTPSMAANTFFQVVTSFTVTNATHNVTLNDFTQNWFEGSASDKSYGTYFDDKILFSITYGTGATTNNRVLLYDILNQGWLVWNLPANGFYVKANKLYFGGASSGYIFKYGDVENDNGSAINSYWKSKDFFGDDPFSNDEVDNISISAKAVANSTATVTYTVNGSSSAYFYMPLASSNSFINKNKKLPAGVNANNALNVQIGNNAVDQPWEIFAIQIGLRPKPWVPSP